MSLREPLLTDDVLAKQGAGSQFLLGLLIFVSGFIPGGLGTPFSTVSYTALSWSWIIFAVLQAGGLLLTTMADGS
jgi:hypothetical protein